MGIAKALRQVMIYSINNKYDWVLTLDQDSIPSKDLIRNYIRYIDTLKNIGAMTCIIKDRNFKNDEMVKMVIFVIL
jgi:rhamnosyltransferase